MATARTRTGSARSAGLLVALVLAAVFAVLIGYFVWQAEPRDAGATQPELLRPPDIKDIPRDTGPGSLAVGTTMQTGVQVADRNDPTRLAAEINYASVEPLEGKRYRVEKPRATIFLSSGSQLLVEADGGQLYMPDRNQQPESGTLRGHTVVRLYTPRDNGTAIDVAKDKPALVFKTDSLSFDGAIGEISTDDRVEVVSDWADFSGTGLRLLVNQTRDRLVLMEIARGERIQIHADAPARQRKVSSETTAGTSPGAAGATVEPAAGAVASTDAIAEVFYKIVLSEGVKIAQGARVVRGDRLEAWARTLDGKLAPDAIASIQQGSGAPGDGAAPRTDAATPDGNEAAPLAAGVPAEAGATPPDVEIVFSGPMSVMPQAARPLELARDEVSLRITADQTGLVTFEDPGSGASGRCAALEYGATSRVLTMSGVGPSSVALTMPQTGSIMAGRLKADLGVGVIYIPGPYVLNSDSADRAAAVLAGPERESRETRETRESREPRMQQIAGAEQADFEFFTDENGMTRALRYASFQGDVRATDGESTLECDTLIARFLQATPDPEAGPDAPAVSYVHRIEADGNVLAADGKDSSLGAQRLELALGRDEKTGRSEPRHVVARGDVDVQRSGDRLRCGILDADLTRDEEGKQTVANVLAEDDVEFTRKDGVSASAARLTASDLSKIVDLTGEGSRVASGGSSIVGGYIQLNGLARTMEVFGPGVFDHVAGADEGREVREGESRLTGSARVTWTDSLFFDDRQGVVDCLGDVRGTYSPDEDTTDTLWAARVRLTLESAPEGVSDVVSARGATERGGKRGRELLTATAWGDGVQPATVESRRTAVRDSQRVLAELMYLEGPEVIADNGVGTLSVPAAGRMVLSDRRERDSDRSEGDVLGPGDALLTWQGSMSMNRTDGKVSLDQGVAITHARQSDRQITELECAHADATLERKAEKSTSGRLVAALARGSVYARSGGKELVAETVDYDVVRGMLTATAADPGVVTMFDATSGAPMTARELVWDLIKNTIEVRKPGPIVVPR